MFKHIFLNENVRISNEISLKYVPWGLIDNMSALVQIMAWRRPGDKPLSEPMLTQFTDAYMQHYGDMSFRDWLVLLQDTTELIHYSDITWAWRYLESPVTWLFVQQLVQANTKKATNSALLVLHEGNPLMISCVCILVFHIPFNHTCHEIIWFKTHDAKPRQHH